MSGIRTGMHSGRGDPGQGSNREGDIRKGKYSRDKDSRQWRDEGRMREDKSGKKELLDRCIVCFSFGVKHHRHWECPDNIASVKKPGQSKRRILQGDVGVHPCRMTLDSGADHTVVRADLISESDYTGRSSCLKNNPSCLFSPHSALTK